MFEGGAMLKINVPLFYVFYMREFIVTAQDDRAADEEEEGGGGGGGRERDFI